MMEIEIYAIELQVGDVWQGRRVVAIHPPFVKGGYLQISFETGYDVSMAQNAKLLVIRKIERIN
jgi:hypothetical protein